MRITFFLITLLAFNACSRNKIDNDKLSFLNQLTINNYEYLNSTTSHLQNIDLAQIADAKLLKEFSDSLLYIADGNSETENNYRKFITRSFKNYNIEESSYVDKIISDSGEISDFDIKLLEYIILNAIIKAYYDVIFDFDRFEIVVAPEKDRIKLGETYSGQIFFSANNEHAPNMLIIDGDTIKENNDSKYFAPSFSFTPTSKGEFMHELTFLQYDKGKYLRYEFNIKYFVE